MRELPRLELMGSAGATGTVTIGQFGKERLGVSVMGVSKIEEWMRP